MRVVSVNVGRCETIMVGGRAVRSGIGKRPVRGRVRLGTLGLEGDEQADRRLHGGEGKAVYAYSQEGYEFWERELSTKGDGSLWSDVLQHGRMGENLTIEGLVESNLWIGDRLVMRECVLEVTESRTPCGKFVAALGMKEAARAMVRSELCGAYLKVVEGGSVMAGDEVVVERGEQRVRLVEHFRRAVGGQSAVA